MSSVSDHRAGRRIQLGDPHHPADEATPAAVGRPDRQLREAIPVHVAEERERAAQATAAERRGRGDLVAGDRNSERVQEEHVDGSRCRAVVRVGADCDVGAARAVEVAERGDRRAELLAAAHRRGRGELRAPQHDVAVDGVGDGGDQPEQSQHDPEIANATRQGDHDPTS